MALASGAVDPEQVAADDLALKHIVEANGAAKLAEEARAEAERIRSGGRS